MSNTVETIDMTPSFAESTAICLAVIENYASKDRPNWGLCESYKTARAELMRYARELDRLKAQTGTTFDAADTPVEGE